jgi:hypothetical protein
MRRLWRPSWVCGFAEMGSAPAIRKTPAKILSSARNLATLPVFEAGIPAGRWQPGAGALFYAPAITMGIVGLSLPPSGSMVTANIFGVIFLSAHGITIEALP